MIETITALTAPGTAVYTALHLVFLFFVYSMIGWCVEVIFAAVTTRELSNRGFLNGPVCPIYGCGMTALLLLLGRWSHPAPAASGWQGVAVVFFGGAALATLVELIGGYLLYKAFHTRWWDYSNFRWNLGGFICPQFSLLWGVGSVIVIRVVHPLIDGGVSRLPGVFLLVFDAAALAVFLVDLGVSVAAAVGLDRDLRRLADLQASIRKTSDALTELLGTGAMTVDTLLDEQKLQLTLGAMEGRDNAAELRGQLHDLAARVQAMHIDLEKLSRQRFFGPGRLLRAFPAMKNMRYNDALTRLRAITAHLKQRIGKK